MADDERAMLAQGIARPHDAAQPFRAARASLDQALQAAGDDLQLRRALIHAAGALDRRLGRAGALPNRETRRQKYD